MRGVFCLFLLQFVRSHFKIISESLKSLQENVLAAIENLQNGFTDALISIAYQGYSL